MGGLRFDSHVHSLASPDSQMPPQAAVQAARALGLGVTFTEHVDYVTPDFGFDPTADDKPMENDDFVADAALYPHGYAHLRADDVLLGLEIGLTDYYLPLNRQTAAAYDYDFILGSVHFVSGYELYHDAVRKRDYDYDRKQRMLTYSRRMVEGSGDFIHAFGHIDYISRYYPGEDKLVRPADYPDEYDALLKALAERGLALEINTARFGRLPGLEENLAAIFKRFAGLGGRFATIGSDAHTPDMLGRAHAQAVRLADECGLNVVYFKMGKRIER